MNFLETITKKINVLVILLFLLTTNSFASIKISNNVTSHTKYIAIMADLNTCTDFLEELNLYIKSISSEGYGTYLLCEQWKNAAHVKNEVFKLYSEKKIEGAVFLGNIPKIKLTFINKKEFSEEESFESNYFYENFSEKFSLLKKDAKYEYYFVNNNVSKINKDIYISRIPEQVKNIGTYFTRTADFYSGINSKTVKNVVGIVDQSFMYGSDSAIKTDAAILKETIEYFYNDKQSKVTYLKYDSATSLNEWNKKNSNLGYLFFNGSKKEYLKNSKSDLLITTSIEVEDQTALLSGKHYAILSFSENLKNENIVPPFYYMFFAGHRVGIYYRNLKNIQVMLYGDPLFCFTKGEKVVFDSSTTRISRLMNLQRIIEHNRQISKEVVEKLLNDKDEKIRYEVFTWLKNNYPGNIITYADKLILDPSDRVFKYFIESVVSLNDKKIIPFLIKSRDYFKLQGENIRTGVLNKSLEQLSSSSNAGKES